MNRIIDSFSNQYYFLSNMSSFGFYFREKYFPTNEHFYVCSKINPLCDNYHKIFTSILQEHNPYKVKKIGRSVPLRKGWKEEKLCNRFMYCGVYNKFLQNEGIKQKLLDLKDYVLIEGNYWKDTWWGMCDGVGNNYLGKIIMLVRDSFLKGI